MTELRKKPWNRVDQPVYSIASAWNGKANMNICTYAVPVSMKPKLYVVAIYRNTCTLDLVTQSREFVLQLLCEKHYRLVKLFGKTSGRNTDKLSKIKFPLGSYQSIPYLTDALAIVHLSVLDFIETGDHISTICRVNAYRNLSIGKPLTIRYLQQKKIIRA
ncbi:MAG: flavin reductase family protein [Cyclobacteriaceae bacterium]|nr:flavin reductase family protein [Cyclobacteriaceae bacterium]MDW8332231.1 flavin reductase family protein [Cyclobacteriaceae bacterium]